MDVTLSQPATIAMRTLPEDDRRRVASWIDHLKNWHNDPFVRSHSRRLDGDDGVYMLLTSTDFRVFFELQDREITVLDIARQDMLQSFGQASGHGRP